jgi:hypothetical protein
VDERLSTELGWTTPDEVISLADLFGLSDDIYAAASYDTLETKAAVMRRNGMAGRVF